MALVVTLNGSQWSRLEGLAGWIAEHAYFVERVGGVDDPEHSKIDKSVRMCFDELDRLGVPYWVQNAVIGWARDWRAYKSEYMDHGLRRRHYGVEFLGAGCYRMTCGVVQ